MVKVSLSIDEVRNYWNARPCNLRHSQSVIGTREYFDEVEARKYFVEPHIIEFAKFPTWQNKKVLEIGCGIGTDAINFARSGAIYTGIELSGESLNLAKQRFNVFGLSGTFFEGDAENLSEIPLENSYDLIYSFGVLHHTPNIEKALKEIKEISNEQTIFKFMVYASNSWKQAMINAGLDQPEAQFGCPIANSYTKDEVSSLLDGAGFKLDSIKQDHIFPYNVEKYKIYEYQKNPWFENMPNEVMKVLEQNFGWHLLVDASLK
jgi:SAM-dependent methyltransferase